MHVMVALLLHSLNSDGTHFGKRPLSRWPRWLFSARTLTQVLMFGARPGWCFTCLTTAVKRLAHIKSQ